ncbi:MULTISPECIES: heme ABC exporter ATP-binding protein CcmA [unclassified Novosphingobium]|uniref:heme ABC exporter ATP-binding protein CcmA n=1 Tax=unclassified Novosphingobium TaxID=2644732 RepID=UPI0017B4490E|nr:MULTISPECIES: heme ABC exporter ATP-binding protein CcmA [unclassified Novosphingobium]NMN06240.1 heme exporter protein A [Novosphingobium sp. SG919]NMN88537.1 heme exporter protein A [Novosphingobium sp. SG916]
MTKVDHMTALHLAAHDIACRRGDRVLFRGVGFALGPGDALHLAGANGIGKSSLIRILAGLMRPFAGTVERQGAVALVDERLALDGHLPLGRALAFWHRIDGTAPDADDPFGLADLADVPVRYLSTGQKKRAALARLAAAKAPIWLLDEPLNGLDTAWAAQAQAAIEAHRAGGGLVVIASHQPLALAGVKTLAMADHVPLPHGDDAEGDWA